MRAVVHHLIVASLATCGAFGCSRSGSAIEPVVPPAEVRRVADAEAAFALRLLGQLADERPGVNLLIGPDSIFGALALTASGANGATRAQLLAALALDPAQDAPLEAVAALHFQLARAADAGDIELATVQRLWVDRTLPLGDAWTQRVATHFDDAFGSLDFKGQPDAARDRINDFVADATDDKIRDLMPAGSIDDLTRLVVTSATWFKGSWAREFKRGDTRPAPFTKRDGSKVDAPFMFQEKHFACAKFDDGAAIEMPYEGGEFAMLIFVPNDATTIRSLAPDTFDRRAKKLEDADVRVFVPRFTFRGSYALAPALAKFGVTDAFDAQRADLKRISNGDVLFLADIRHQSFIEVDEEGTEAAAATGGEVVMAEETMNEFHADRPFVFAIRHRPTGAILFAGIVEDPTKS